jgi:DNA topoisomerase-1
MTKNKTLVIVESPAKCKKIEEYLGVGYKCVASYGHLRELKTINNITIQHGNVIAVYSVMESKKKQIELLRKEIKTASEVILATDNDREGEAISWHICELFELDINTTKRITFNEITETAIKTAIQNPTLLNMKLVHAQQSRQILDILVGFKVSPMLWKFISKNRENSLSAGRCQTPALKLIYENYIDIKENIGEKKIYNTDGYFTNSNIVFSLNKQFETEKETKEFLEGSKSFVHIYTSSEPATLYKKPPSPFITSTIQQTASNVFQYSPKETMRICQLLYEEGFITYMRTDSATYSNEFIDEAKKYIVNRFEEKYVNEEIDLLVNVKKNEEDKQEAHEAIRPTNISLLEIPESFDKKERKLYQHIWENTVASCMASVKTHSITSIITAYNNTKFMNKSEQIIFAGWKAASKKYLVETNKEYSYLKTIKQNEMMKYKKICSHISVQGKKQHYTEAKLVNLLEERGIGRPSTFSSLVDKIQERKYVKKCNIKGKEITCKEFELEKEKIVEIETKREFGNEKNKLVIQPVGIMVIEFLDKYFHEIFQYEFTRNMEDTLDKISKGIMNQNDICIECNNQLDLFISNLDREKKVEIVLDEKHTYIIGKHGPVIKCLENGKISFKSIKENIDIDFLRKKEFKSIEELIDDKKIIESEEIPIVKKETDEKTDLPINKIILGKHDGKDVILRRSEYGLYIKWGENSKTLKELGNRPIENITFEEIKTYLEEDNRPVREISKDVTIRKGPRGDYLFYKTAKMKKPKFYDIKAFTTDVKTDYKICDIHILKKWILETHNIKI